MVFRFTLVLEETMLGEGWENVFLVQTNASLMPSWRKVGRLRSRIRTKRMDDKLLEIVFLCCACIYLIG